MRGPRVLGVLAQEALGLADDAVVEPFLGEPRDVGVLVVALVSR